MARKPRGYWENYDNCYKEAKKCKSLTEFSKVCDAGYRISKKNQWIKDYTWLVKKKKPNGYWNYKRCYKEAKKYCTKTEFRNGCKSAYESAYRNKWLDGYDWLKDKRFNIYNDKIDCVYVYEFIEYNAAYVGRTLINRQTNRDIEHIFKKDSVSSFAKKNNIAVPPMKILETNLTLKEGVQKENEWLEKYKQDGWLILNKAKTGSIGRLGNRKWTKEKCCEESKKYKTRREFEKCCECAYEVALKNKWIDEFIWLKYIIKPKGYWTQKTCYDEAFKYKTKSDFAKYCSGAYNVARKNKWLDDYTWFSKRFVWDYKTCFIEAQKYKTRTEFQNCSRGAYLAAYYNKWLDDYTWFVNGLTLARKK